MGTILTVKHGTSEVRPSVHCGQTKRSGLRTDSDLPLKGGVWRRVSELEERRVWGRGGTQDTEF